jgi:murein DD-endopeptidase MepM/ murein hydrolase activator NlpD
VDRHNDPMSLFESESSESQWRAPVRGASAASPPSNARWLFVTTSLTALIVGSLAWMSLQTMAPVGARGFEKSRQGLMPYRLFQQLTQSGDSLFASAGGNVRAGDGINATPEGILAEEKAAEANPGVDTRTLTLDAGDTLTAALQDSGVSANDAAAAMAALAKVYNPRNLRAGLVFDLVLTTPKPSADTDAETAVQLTSLKFSPTIEHDITVTRTADGSFSANDAVIQLSAQVHRAGTTIDSSLYLSAMQAGIPADVVVEMIRMFSYKVDFQRDIHPGDSFEVFYDYYYTPQGQPARVGNITYARMRLGGSDISLYRFQPNPNAPADYYDAKGQSAKGMLMKTPVDGARITSGFGMRFHPVLGYTRMHKGIDFGVPIGTPVMAAGSGTVKIAGWMNGYGNFILVDHGNGYSTGYGHLSRIAAGIRPGAHVRQAQVIARSGMTGIATGPHLHYEIRVNGSQVNPLRVRVANGRKLSGPDLRKYLETRQHIDATIAATRLETKVADISANSVALGSH